jgi:2-C-methyl-D-erythritol 4-phosphate cytidylyltransferase/2-C-methyl-D-erythritol 2,4-cyclodiphosphate synthase
MTPFPVAALIVAAGRGRRIGGPVPKQYRMVAGRSVLAHAIAHIGKAAEIGLVMIVIHPDDAEDCRIAIEASGVESARVKITAGGETRQDSVLAGLEALAGEDLALEAIVLVHDAARPFPSETVILRALIAGAQHGAAIPVLPVADTLGIVDAKGLLTGAHDRTSARIVQTPQAFRFGLLLEAHRRAASEERADFTDDAGVVAAYGHAVGTFEGDPALFKITLEADIARAERHVAESDIAGRYACAREARTGMGYDVHAFTDGDHVWLGGVSIPHERALLGHSDADPVLHALTDALLGTIGDGDIGMHFPPSDEKWRGAASHLFLEDAARRVRERGGRIISVDCTIVCEAPKIGPHRAAMQVRIGAILGLAIDRVGVKATTSERLGFTGRREGIAAIAVASVAF